MTGNPRILNDQNPYTGLHVCGPVLVQWERGARQAGELVTFHVDRDGRQHCRVRFQAEAEVAIYETILVDRGPTR